MEISAIKTGGIVGNKMFRDDLVANFIAWSESAEQMLMRHKIANRDPPTADANDFSHKDLKKKIKVKTELL